MYHMLHIIHIISKCIKYMTKISFRFFVYINTNLFKYKFILVYLRIFIIKQIFKSIKLFHFC